MPLNTAALFSLAGNKIQLRVVQHYVCTGKANSQTGKLSGLRCELLRSIAFFMHLPEKGRGLFFRGLQHVFVDYEMAVDGFK